MNIRVGVGYDVHPFATEDSGRRLVLGGVAIDHVGLAGHSDADAVAHAVADSLLGVCGLGDLGSMFPSSDEQWRDANSMALLEQVAARVRSAGWTVGNVDIVIVAEVPRLAPHVDAMARNVRAVLASVADGPDGVHVAVQPKRGEGVGALGRGDGIAVHAVALVTRLSAV